MATNLFDLAKELPPWVALGLGVITGGLRSAWNFIYEHTIGYAVTRVSISLTVEDSEYRDAYLWLSSWVEKNLRGRQINSLLLRMRKHEDDSESQNGAGFEVIPEYGTYYLMYKRRLMLVEHRKEVETARSGQSRPLRTIRLQVWLSWNRALLLEILREARSSYEQGRSRRVEHLRPDTYGEWTGTMIPARAMSSLFHRPDLLRDLLEDVRMFLDSKKMYEDLGIPYRRGYLLAGPPGTGKSSLILALASHFQLPIYTVPLRGVEVSGERLANMLANCRKPSIVALEDVDCMKVTTSRKPETNDRLTIADLLNVVDGIGASEDRLLFMTANQPEILDYALTRAGRVDRKFCIDYARDEELRSFHARVSEYMPVEPWREFRAALPERATIADAQAFALRGKCMAKVTR